MSYIKFESHLATDVEATSSNATVAMPISIGAISLATGDIFYQELRILEKDIPLVGKPGEKGTNDKGPLHAAGFTLEDILMPQKPTIPEGLEVFFDWTKQQISGRILITQGGSDITIIERNTKLAGLPWPDRFHSTSDLRSWATMYAIQNGITVPLTQEGTSSMNLKTIMDMLGINDIRQEGHVALIDAAYTAQMASMLIRGIPFYTDLSAALQSMTVMVEEYRKQLVRYEISGPSAVLLANIRRNK